MKTDNKNFHSVEVKQGNVLQNLQESLSSWHSDLGWKE